MPTITENVLDTTSVVKYTKMANEFILKNNLDNNQEILESLLMPQREITVEIPIRLDNGKFKTFTGFRVQHNDARGPYKGGLRFHPSVTLSEARILAHLMSLKTSLANIPFGGGKGGIACNPKELSLRELEYLTRNFTNLIADNIGPLKDIPAPDVNTTSQIMAWIVDEYSRSRGKHYGVVTGKPIELGGSLGRDEATGRGVMIAVRQICKAKNVDLSKSKVVFQGFGNLAYFGSKLIESELKAKVVGVSTSMGAIYNKNGLDLDKAYEYYQKHKNLDGYKDCEKMTNAQLLESDCDILIPSALENAITIDNAANIKAKILVEGANDCTTSAADEILNDKGITVIPDILANAGGVIVSYFEWVQNLNNYYWDLSMVRESLDKKLVASFNDVLELANKYNISLRKSAYVVAIQRIARATLLRGV